MTIKSIEEVVIYESPDGGKTVYARQSGSSSRWLHHIDPEYQKEQTRLVRWANLKEALVMAETDPILNDLIEKVEIYFELKK